MPGAEAVVREPWRMAASFLYNAFGDSFLKIKIEFVRMLDRKKWRVVREMMKKGVNSPLTSSAGRLFDAAASLVLSRDTASFEAELPMALEKLADNACGDSYAFELARADELVIAEPSPVIKEMVNDLTKGAAKKDISAKFHNAVADMITRSALSLKKRYGAEKIVLSGGVFQNRFLSAKAVFLLKKRGFTILMNTDVPVNDSGIPIGQLILAGARNICA
jgi:hydrogenase maturation protein HypF